MLVTPTTESPVAAVETADPNAKSKPRIFLGLTMGLLAAAIGALYSVYATYGLARGLKSADMTRYVTARRGLACQASNERLGKPGHFHYPPGYAK